MSHVYTIQNFPEKTDNECVLQWIDMGETCLLGRGVEITPIKYVNSQNGFEMPLMSVSGNGSIFKKNQPISQSIYAKKSGLIITPIALECRYGTITKLLVRIEKTLTLQQVLKQCS